MAYKRPWERWEKKRETVSVRVRASEQTPAHLKTGEHDHFLWCLMQKAAALCCALAWQQINSAERHGDIQPWQYLADAKATCSFQSGSKGSSCYILGTDTSFTNSRVHSSHCTLTHLKNNQWKNSPRQTVTFSHLCLPSYMRDWWSQILKLYNDWGLIKGFVSSCC